MRLGPTTVCPEIALFRSAIASSATPLHACALALSIALFSWGAFYSTITPNHRLVERSKKRKRVHRDLIPNALRKLRGVPPFILALFILDIRKTIHNHFLNIISGIGSARVIARSESSGFFPPPINVLMHVTPADVTEGFQFEGSVEYNLFCGHPWLSRYESEPDRIGLDWIGLNDLAQYRGKS